MMLLRMVMTLLPLLVEQTLLGMQLTFQVRPDAPNRSATFKATALLHPHASSNSSIVSSPRMPTDAL